MNKISKDGRGNIVVSFDGLSCLISAYSPKLKALKVSFGYNTPDEMAEILTNIFSVEKQVLEKFTEDKRASFENICFIYYGSRVIIKKEMEKQEIKKMLRKIEQG